MESIKPQGDFLKSEQPGGGFSARLHSENATMIGIEPILPLTSRETSKSLILQAYSVLDQQWIDLDRIQLEREGHVLGRNRISESIRSSPSMAPSHARLTYEKPHVFIESLDSINGVYLRLKPGRKVALRSGTRFMIVKYVIEFRLPERAVPAIEPAVSDQGEVFLSRPVRAFAFLDFLGPDARPCLTIPITRSRPTVLGRPHEEGDRAIEILDDESNLVSRNHCELSRDSNGDFVLQDLESSNGTYIRVEGRTELKVGTLAQPSLGDAFTMGGMLMRLVERY